MMQNDHHCHHKNNGYHYYHHHHPYFNHHPHHLIIIIPHYYHHHHHHHTSLSSSTLSKYITIIKIIFIKITFRRSQQHDYLEVKALVPPLQACSTWRWRNRTHECQIDALSVVVVVVVDNEEPVSDRWMRMADR